VRLVRAETEDGMVRHFEGDRDNERQVCVELTDGTVW
jgi:hypothetical protein